MARGSTATAAAPARRPPPPPAAPAALTVDRGAKSATTVTVCCKIPNGLVLQLYKEEPYDDPLRDGGAVRRKRFVAIPGGKAYTVRGPAEPANRVKGFVVAPKAGGYALTPNIPADFFREWMAQNHLNPVVTSGMIFAEPRSSDARDHAKEQRALLSGLEPLNMSDVDKPDPRAPRSLDANVSNIATADEILDRAPAAGYDDEGG